MNYLNSSAATQPQANSASADADASSDPIELYVQGTSFGGPNSLIVPRSSLQANFVAAIRRLFLIPPSHRHLSFETPDGIPVNSDCLADPSTTIIFIFTDAIPRVTQRIERVSNFTPHPNVIYKSGRWGEEGQISFPTAELIDNSLWATEMQLRESAEPNYLKSIKISIIHEKDEASKEDRIHLLVSDNGIGMTAQSITDCLTLSFDQSTRFQRPFADSSNADLNVRYLNSLISKYGVGLKFAAAFMGSDLSIISKTSRMKSCVDLHLSEATLLEKYSEGQNPWSEKTSERPPGDRNSSAIPEKLRKCEKIKQLIDGEVGKSHFTNIIVWNIRSHLLSQLGRPPSSAESPDPQLYNLAEEFAQIYHYYLHGPFGRSFPKRAPQFVSTQMLIERCWKAGSQLVTKSIDIASIESDLASQFHNNSAGDPLRFSFRHKNPQDGTTALVLGEVRFFPCKNDEETVPISRLEKEKLIEEKKSNSFIEEENDNLPANNNLNSAAGDEDSERSTEKDFRFACYWHGRFIPGSKVICFDFMLIQQRLINLGLNHRWRCHLFFDHKTPVNQQKIDLNLAIGRENSVSNVQIYFNDSDLIDPAVEESIDWRPQTRSRNPAIAAPPKQQFRNWLEKNHSLYDQLVQFLEEIRNRPGHYKSCQFSAGGEPVKVGDIVKLKEGGNWFGKILEFEVKPGMRIEGMDFDFSKGTIAISRLPTEIYGWENRELKRIDLLDKTRTIIQCEVPGMGKIRCDEAFPNYLLSQMALWPDRIEIEPYDFSGNFKVPQPANGAYGFNFPSMAIKVFGHIYNGERKLLHTIPAKSNKKERLKVRRSVVYFDPDAKKFIVSNEDREEIELKPYSAELQATYGRIIGIMKSGRYKMLYEVISENHPAEEFRLSKEIAFTVAPGDIHSLAIQSGISPEARLGSSLLLPLDAIDKFENSVIPSADDEPPPLKFDTAGKLQIDAKFIIKRGDSARLMLNLTQIKPGPKFQHQKDSQTIQVSPQFGNEFSVTFAPFSLSLLPAMPTSIVCKRFLQSFPASIINGSNIPPFSVTFLDRFGFPTVAANRKHRVVLSAEPAIKNWKCALDPEVESRNSSSLPYSFNYRGSRLTIPSEMLTGPNSTATVKFRLFYETPGDNEEGLEIAPIETVAEILADPAPKRAKLHLDGVGKREGELDGSQSNESAFTVGVGEEVRFMIEFVNEVNRPIREELTSIDKIELHAFGRRSIVPVISVLNAAGDRLIPLIFTVPNQLAAAQDCSLSFKVSDNPSFPRFDFKILPRFGPPNSFVIESPLGISVGVPAPIRVGLIDSNGNRIRIPADFIARPRLFCESQPDISVTGINESDCQIIQNAAGSVDYFLFPAFLFLGPIGSYSIRASSAAAENLQSASVLFKISHGVFHHLEYSFGSTFGIQLPAFKLATRATLSMNVKACDEAGNRVESFSEAVEFAPASTDSLDLIMVQPSSAANSTSFVARGSIQLVMNRGFAVVPELILYCNATIGTEIRAVLRPTNPSRQVNRELTTILKFLIAPSGRLLDFTIQHSGATVRINSKPGQQSKSVSRVGDRIPDIDIHMSFEGRELIDFHQFPISSFELDFSDPRGGEFRIGNPTFIQSEAGEYFIRFANTNGATFTTAGAHDIRVRFDERRMNLARILPAVEGSFIRTQRLLVEPNDGQLAVLSSVVNNSISRPNPILHAPVEPTVSSFSTRLAVLIDRLDRWIDQISLSAASDADLLASLNSISSKFKTLDVEDSPPPSEAAQIRSRFFKTFPDQYFGLLTDAFVAPRSPITKFLSNAIHGNSKLAGIHLVKSMESEAAAALTEAGKIIPLTIKYIEQPMRSAATAAVIPPAGVNSLIELFTPQSNHPLGSEKLNLLRQSIFSDYYSANSIEIARKFSIENHRFCLFLNEEQKSGSIFYPSGMEFITPIVLDDGNCEFAEENNSIQSLTAARAALLEEQRSRSKRQYFIDAKEEIKQLKNSHERRFVVGVGGPASENAEENEKLKIIENKLYQPKEGNLSWNGNAILNQQGNEENHNQNENENDESQNNNNSNVISLRKRRRDSSNEISNNKKSAKIVEFDGDESATDDSGSETELIEVEQQQSQNQNTSRDQDHEQIIID